MSVHVSVARERKPLLSATRMEKLSNANTAASYVQAIYTSISQLLQLEHILAHNMPLLLKLGNKT